MSNLSKEQIAFIHPYNVEVKIQNKIIDDLISCLNQKRKVNFDEEQ